MSDDITSFALLAEDEHMQRFIDGDDSIVPSTMHNIPRMHRIACARAERYTRWIKMCDEILRVKPNG